MSSYGVAKTKDQLSSLIDKALAGEEVIITRHGRPVVQMRGMNGTDHGVRGRAAALARLTAVRESLPKMDTPYLELKRLDEAESER